MTQQLRHITELKSGDQIFKTISFKNIAQQYELDRLPFSIKILLENLLRHEDESFVQPEDIHQVAKWETDKDIQHEIAFVPSRVILQDFTGVPAIVDLAAMRNAMEKLGGQAEKINPFNPVELVIDHSVMVDVFARDDALEKNTQIEIERNRERYQFLKWGQSAFSNFKVVPPGRGIVHQINLEYLARCVFDTEKDGVRWAYPDTLVATDSHTTMINGLGILGWGVGGIEAEAAMLGQPVTMLIPKVVGFKLKNQLQAGVTATDMVLTITETLRNHGVVGKFVEFFGPGLQHLSIADRATISNMAPEYGATCGMFPLDEEALRYLKLTGRRQEHIQLVEDYARALGIWHDKNSPEASYHETLELDLSQVQPSIAGPTRPQDRITLSEAAKKFTNWLEERLSLSERPAQSDFSDEGGHVPDIERNNPLKKGITVDFKEHTFDLTPGSVVIAAITSCTNTSNPSVLMAAGLMAKIAREKGLTSKPWVKTSLAPGSQVVTEYLKKAGLMEHLDALGFNLVGYGCTTCIGNSGPLPEPIQEGVRMGKVPVCSVLSGNRNFEGRIHPDVPANYLASPPLVVAYALAGNMQIDITREPIGYDKNSQAVFLKDIWPSEQEIKDAVDDFVSEKLFRDKYAGIYSGNNVWDGLEVSNKKTYDWPDSSYIKEPPFFSEMEKQVPKNKPIENARCLVKVSDSITTDHISPAGAIAETSPAGEYLKSLGIQPKDFNSYGSRRGNHEVMMRGTFANVRLKNELAPGTEGSYTSHFPSREKMSIVDAAQKYRQNHVDSVIMAGKEYGTGSSRDWAAKGPALLGVRAVLAESYERIHRSNLIGMGVLPLEFKKGESAEFHNLEGDECFSIPAVQSVDKTVTVTVTGGHRDEKKEIEMKVRIDTANEFLYFSHGGILQYSIRRLLE